MVESGSSDTLIKPINDDYGYGTLGDIKVVIRLRDGRINATKLASLKKQKNGNPFPKALISYRRIEGNKELLEEFGGECGSPPNLFQETTNTDLANQELSRDNIDIIQGCYTIPEIAIDIARWVSSKYHVHMLRIVREHNKREVYALQHKNDSLTKRLEEMEARMDKKLSTVLVHTSEIKDELVEVKDELVEVKDELNELYNIVKEQIGKQGTDKDERISVYGINDTNKVVVRARQRRTDYNNVPNSTLLYRSKHITNAKTVNQTLKDNSILPKGKSTTFTLDKDGKTKLINVLKYLDNRMGEIQKK